MHSTQKHTQNALVDFVVDEVAHHLHAGILQHDGLLGQYATQQPIEVVLVAMVDEEAQLHEQEVELVSCHAPLLHHTRHVGSHIILVDLLVEEELLRDGILEETRQHREAYLVVNDAAIQCEHQQLTEH